nr:hypothetical protein CFP56_04159 [Quercus suber]
MGKHRGARGCSLAWVPVAWLAAWLLFPLYCSLERAMSGACECGGTVLRCRRDTVGRGQARYSAVPCRPVLLSPTIDRVPGTMTELHAIRGVCRIRGAATR